MECDSRMETERFEARRALQRKKFEEFTEVVNLDTFILETIDLLLV